MSKRITIEELQSYLWNSAVLLRTNIDAGAYKQYIFPLLFFKRICDVYDEETTTAIMPEGRIGFVEVKAPGKEPRPLQVRRHEMLRNLGFKVYVLDDPGEIGGILHEIRTT